MSNKLTKEKALREVDEIKKCISDDEIAHSMEDGLYHSFVHAVMNGEYKTIQEAKEVAEVIATTSKLDFARWCA